MGVATPTCLERCGVQGLGLQGLGVKNWEWRHVFVILLLALSYYHSCYMFSIVVGRGGKVFVGFELRVARVWEVSLRGSRTYCRSFRVCIFGFSA